MDHVGAAVRDVGALDQIAELALGEARPQAVAQRRHAEIGEMRRRCAASRVPRPT